MSFRKNLTFIIKQKHFYKIKLYLKKDKNLNNRKWLQEVNCFVLTSVDVIKTRPGNSGRIFEAIEKFGRARSGNWFDKRSGLKSIKSQDLLLGLHSANGQKLWKKNTRCSRRQGTGRSRGQRSRTELLTAGGAVHGAGVFFVSLVLLSHIYLWKPTLFYFWCKWWFDSQRKVKKMFVRQQQFPVEVKVKLCR